MNRLIPLNKGFFAQVSEQDYDFLIKHKWYKSSSGYAVRHNKEKSPALIYMHRQVLNLKKGEWTDHIDRDRLNNTRDNLRKCTPSENNRNRSPLVGKTSKFKGVYYNKERKCFCACIRHNDVQKHIGVFLNEADAAIAYNNAAKLYFGEHAYINEVNCE